MVDFLIHCMLNKSSIELSKIGNHFCPLKIEVVKKRSHKMVLFNRKKFVINIQIFFFSNDWLWKSNFCNFWQVSATKYNNSLWVGMLIFRQKKSNFVSLPSKLDNPYYHSLLSEKVILLLVAWCGGRYCNLEAELLRSCKCSSVHTIQFAKIFTHYCLFLSNIKG